MHFHIGFVKNPEAWVGRLGQPITVRGCVAWSPVTPWSAVLIVSIFHGGLHGDGNDGGKSRQRRLCFVSTRHRIALR